MKVHTPNNCSNSPRSLVAIKIAIHLAANDFSNLEPLLAENFTWSRANGDKEIAKERVELHMNNVAHSEHRVEDFDVLTSISHGKYAAVSSCAHTAAGAIVSSHDLYEFTSASSSGKLLKVTSYTVNTVQK